MVLSSKESCQGFWDQYESSCKPCETICQDPKLKNECTNSCKDYIHTTMITQETVKADIHKLTIMVAATAAMTSLVLIILFLLVIIKVNKKKRKAKGILPYTVYNVSSDKVDINTKTDKTIKVAEKAGDSGNVSGTSNDDSGTCNDESVLSAAKLASSRSVVSGLVSMPSVGTVTTQLSDETLQNGFTRYSTHENTEAHSRRGSSRSLTRGKINMTPSSCSTTINNNMSRSNHNNHNHNYHNYHNGTSRFPSEDCVMDSEGGRHNLAMESSSTSTNSPVPLSQVV